MNHNSYNQSGDQSPNNSPATGWDSLSNVAYTPESNENSAETPVRRKAEVAHFLLTDSLPSEGSDHLLSKADIEDSYRIAMRSGDGLNAKEITFMQQIDTPLGHNLEHTQDVFNSLERQEQKVLSFISGVGFDNYEQGHFADLNTVVGRYPSPSMLVPQMNQLLTLLAQHNNPAKVQQYVNSIDNFERKVYGERYEYSKAFDELYNDAKDYHNQHGWAQRINDERDKLLFSTEPAHSQPLEQSPYYNKDLDDRLAAESKAHSEKAARERALEAANEATLNQHARKIINSLMTGKDITSVSDSTLSTGARETFYDWINNGQLTSRHESQLLQTIAPPMKTKNGSFEQTFASLSSPHERGILAFASGRGFSNRSQADTSDLQAVLNQYPTPVEFQAVENSLLNSLRHANNPPEKVAQYQQDLETFKHKFYGKRQEYHEAWQKLEQDASAHQAAEQRFVEHMQSGGMEYQSPEVRAYVQNIQQQNSAPASPNRRDTVSPSQESDTAAAEPKKGVFGKLFGRKK